MTAFIGRSRGVLSTAISFALFLGIQLSGGQNPSRHEVSQDSDGHNAVSRDPEVIVVSDDSVSEAETNDIDDLVGERQSRWEPHYLTGDTWGIRSLLHDRGIKAELIYTGERIFLVKGGVAPLHGHYLDNVDLQIEFDTQSLGLQSGGTLFAYILSNHGVDPSSTVGDLQVTSNIEAFDSIRLFEFWYEQVWLRGQIETLVGLHDLNSEFYTSDYGALFTNSSFGIGPDVSANAPVSIFNVSALGVRLRYRPSERFTLLAAVYDGDPGDPEENTNGMRIRWSRDEGLMSISELQLFGASGTYRFGAWYHSARFPHIHSGSGVSEMHHGNYGIYFSLDQRLFSSQLGSEGGLSGFVHGGLSPPDRSMVTGYLGSGVNYAGLIPGRDDVIGVGIASAFLSSELENSFCETAVEATWKIYVNGFLTMQPDVQLIIHPSGSTHAHEALVAGLRTEINF